MRSVGVKRGRSVVAVAAGRPRPRRLCAVSFAHSPCQGVADSWWSLGTHVGSKVEEPRCVEVAHAPLQLVGQIAAR